MVSRPAGDIIARLTAYGQSLATAESLTGGLLCGALTAIPGSSAVVRGGVIAYSWAVKSALLGVDADLLAARGAVDAEVAAQMARGVCRLLASDWGIATTGVAGPSPSDGKPVGEVHIAVCGPDGRVDLASYVGSSRLSGDRDGIRATCVELALALLTASVPT